MVCLINDVLLNELSFPCTVSELQELLIINKPFEIKAISLSLI